MAQKIIDNKLILRATFKVLSGAAFLWVAYILTAGIFNSTESDNASQHEFDLSTLADNSARYFKIDNRELLVIKTQNKHVVFWAQDPIYGCRLSFDTPFIKPVCINIKYKLDGYNAEKNQQLTAPDFIITPQKILRIL